MIRKGFLTKQESYHAFKRSKSKTLQYLSTGLTLTKEDCVKIMAPILKVTLKKCNTSSTYLRDLVFGPKKYQGFDLLDLYTDIRAHHIEILMKYYEQDNMVGKLHRTSFEKNTNIMWSE